MSDLEQMVAPPGFLEHLDNLGMHPGWKKREPQMWPSPRRTYVAAVWHARDARAALNRAAEFVSPEFAERRNLILANPIPGNSYATCASMVAAYQLVLSGETARSHRHTPNALRMVLDASGGMVTLVNGLAVDMAPGDVVLTPQWHWHGHANDSADDAFWIDVLDVPLVQKLENIFFEHHPDVLEKARGFAPDSSLRLKGTDVIPAARHSVQKIGSGQLPTLALAMSGFSGADRNSYSPGIDNKIIAVAEGSVELVTERLGPVLLERGDVAILPSWTEFEIAASGTSGVVFEVSDAPVFARLGFQNPSSITF